MDPAWTCGLGLLANHYAPLFSSRSYNRFKGSHTVVNPHEQPLMAGTTPVPADMMTCSLKKDSAHSIPFPHE